MTWEEAEEFTWEELSNITWSDVLLEPTELLRKIVEEYESEDIPSSVLIKLQKMCYSLEKTCQSSNIEIPMQIQSVKTKSKISKVEMIATIASIVTIIQFVMSFNKAEPTTIINNYYGDVYIIEEYPKEVDDIIEELKQTGNIQIDVSDDFIDSQPEENLKKKI